MAEAGALSQAGPGVLGQRMGSEYPWEKEVLEFEALRAGWKGAEEARGVGLGHGAAGLWEAGGGNARDSGWEPLVNCQPSVRRSPGEPQVRVHLETGLAQEPGMVPQPKGAAPIETPRTEGTGTPGVDMGPGGGRCTKGAFSFS